MAFGVIGVELDDGAELIGRMGETVLSQVDEAEMVVGVDVVRVPFEGGQMLFGYADGGGTPLELVSLGSIRAAAGQEQRSGESTDNGAEAAAWRVHLITPIPFRPVCRDRARFIPAVAWESPGCRLRARS